MEKFQSLKLVLKVWNKQNFGSLDFYIKSLKKVFMSLDSLIFEVKCFTQLSDFKPICMVGALYNVVVKVLGSRLWLAMDMLISTKYLELIKEKSCLLMV